MFHNTARKPGSMVALVLLLVSVMAVVQISDSSLPVHAATGLQERATTCSSSTSCSLAFTSNPQKGDILVATINFASESGGALPTSASFSDSLCSSWTQPSVSGVTYSGYVYTWYAYCTASAAGADTVTASYSGTSPFATTLSIYDAKGYDPTHISCASGSGDTAAFSTTSVSFFGTPLLIASYAADSGTDTTTPGTGFTALTSGGYALNMYSTSGVSSPTTFPVTSSASQEWAGVGCQFEPTSIPTTVISSGSNKCTSSPCATPALTVYTTGDAIVIAVQVAGATSAPTVSATDTFSDSFSVASGPSVSTSPDCGKSSSYPYCSTYIVYASSKSSGTDTVSVTVSGTVDGIFIEGFVVHGVGAVLATATGTGTSTAIATSTSPSYPAGSFLIASELAPPGAPYPTAGTGFTSVCQTSSSTGPSCEESEIPSAAGSTDFPASMSSSYTWTTVGVVFSPYVVQPIDLSVPYGTTVPVVTVGGSCNQNATSISKVGFTYVQMLQSCSYTLSNPAAGTNTQFVFQGDGTNSGATVSSASCGMPGPCTSLSVVDYYQSYITIQVNEYSGTSGSSYVVGAEQAGTYSKLSLPAGGNLEWVDYGSVMYKGAANFNAAVYTSTEQFSGSCVPSYDLGGCWPMQEGSGVSVFDEGPNSGTGTLTPGSGGFTSGSACPGGSGACVEFTSTTSISVPDNAGLDPTSGITVIGKVYIGSTASADPFISKSGQYIMGTGESSCSTTQLAAAVDIGGTWHQSCVTAPATGAWDTIGFTYNGSLIVPYIDGTPQSSVAATGSISTSTNPLVFGPFAGLEGTMAVYDTAFTQAQVFEWGQAVSSTSENIIGSGGSTVTLGYYKMDINTFKITANAGTFPSGLSAISPNGIVLGSNITLCTMTIPSGASSVSCSGIWSDAGSTVAGFVSSIGGAATNTRWENAANAASSFDVTSTGGTYTAPYWSQNYDTWTFVPQLPTTFSPNITFYISGQYLGTPDTSCLLGIPSSPAQGSYSVSCWYDYNTLVSYPSTSSGNPFGVRWVFNSTTQSYKLTSGGTTESASYYMYSVGTECPDPSTLGAGTQLVEQPWSVVLWPLVLVAAALGYAASDKRNRKGISTYIEVFILIGVVLAGSVAVYAVVSQYEAGASGPSIALQSARIAQGSQYAIVSVQVSNTGDKAFSSLTIQEAQMSLNPQPSWYLSLTNPSDNQVISVNGGLPYTCSVTNGVLTISFTGAYTLSVGSSIQASITISGSNRFTVGTAYQVVVGTTGGAQASVNAVAGLP